MYHHKWIINPKNASVIKIKHLTRLMVSYGHVDRSHRWRINVFLPCFVVVGSITCKLIDLLLSGIIFYGPLNAWKFHLPTVSKPHYSGEFPWVVSISGLFHGDITSDSLGSSGARWMTLHVFFLGESWGCSEDRPWVQPGWDQSSVQAQGPASSPWQGREQGPLI